MLQAWFKKTNDNKERREVVFQSREVLEVLKSILEDYKEEEIRAMLGKDFEGKNWGYKQAEHVAAIRVYEKVIALLTLDRGV